MQSARPISPFVSVRVSPGVAVFLNIFGRKYRAARSSRPRRLLRCRHALCRNSQRRTHQRPPFHEHRCQARNTGPELIRLRTSSMILGSNFENLRVAQ